MYLGYQDILPQMNEFGRHSMAAHSSLIRHGIYKLVWYSQQPMTSLTLQSFINTSFPISFSGLVVQALSHPSRIDLIYSLVPYQTGYTPYSFSLFNYTS